jgi:hypothetical protein
MNKILIFNLLSFLSVHAVAQTKAKKQVSVVHTSTPSRYSMSLQIGGTETLHGESNGLQLSTALDYKLWTFLSLRTRLSWYGFTETFNNYSYVTWALPPDVSDTYHLGLSEKNRHLFWTTGPVFQIGKKWQWSASPQVGIKASFVTFNVTENGTLAEVRHFKADYNFVYGLETKLWYRLNPHLQVGGGIDSYKHKLSRNMESIDKSGRDLSEPDIQNYIRSLMNHRTEQYGALNIGLKYQF